MDDAVAAFSEKSSLIAADCEKTKKLKERLEGLLREAAKVEVELSRADGPQQHETLSRLRAADGPRSQAAAIL